MSNFSYQIATLLEKMTSADKDFRFMATNDLMVELQKDSIKLDDDSERKVVKMLLKLLEDKNGEVQNLAVKCLGPLVSKVKEFQVETIVDTLVSNMLGENEQLRDISSIGLKTVIAELPAASSLASTICTNIKDKLTSAISRQNDVSVQLEVLDIMGDILARFGSVLVSSHSVILNALLPQLSSPRLAVRKRSIIAISYLVISCKDSHFSELMDFLMQELSQNIEDSTSGTFIQCIASITRTAGHRVGDHLDRLIPVINAYCEKDDDELRENCLQAFESFIKRCPKQVSSHISSIVDISITYIAFDPNYNYEADDDDAMDMDGEDEGESDEEYSDDDDMSWKVRRAAAKCLDAVISTRHELLAFIYKKISPVLISRFKEREENVKSDIFHAFISLLKQTKPTVSNDPDAMDSQDGLVLMLQSQIPDLVTAIHKLLKEKSVKTRQGCFNLLTEVVLVLPGALTDHVSDLIPGIQFSLGEKNTNSMIKIDTLTFLNCLMTHHSSSVFHQHINSLVPPVVACVDDPFYKITAEALLVAQQLVKVIRPQGVPAVANYENLTMKLYECTFKRFKASDIDQEVKERAITCMGQIISNCGDILEYELPKCLPIFLERLKNEIARLTTVKALTLMAGSTIRIALNNILKEALPLLSSFLRKNQRALRLCTLSCLGVIVKNYGNHFETSSYFEVLKELPALVNENDLHVSQLTLNLVTCIAQSCPGTLEKIETTILPRCMTLVKSPLLQGAALQSLLDLLHSLVATQSSSISYTALINMLMQPCISDDSRDISISSNKQAFVSTSKCLAALTVTRKHEIHNMVTQFIHDLQEPQKSDRIRLLALLSLGEIGKYIDLSSYRDIKEVIIEAFSSHNEDVKSAASYALGCVSSGNLQVFLPFVLEEISKQSKRQYLILHSLKEIISATSSKKYLDAFMGYIEHIWSVLMDHCECPEEGTRNVVAECLGKLTLVHPEKLLPKLKNYLTSPSPLIRSTVITSLKFMISDQPQPIDALLRISMGDFLESLDDQDLNVRRVALVAFNSAAHNKPSLIRELLNSVLPRLYTETKVRNDLIRQVEMGPFKHTVDDGLDIRKAAFECMYTLLDSCLDRIDLFEYLKHVEEGLTDHYDIKMLTYLMLARLAFLCPNSVLQQLDRIVEPLRQTCTSKVKTNSVKQEFEKQDELKRSALRAVAALHHIQDSDKNPQMNEFLNQIKSNKELAQMYESIQKDTATGHVDSSLGDMTSSMSWS